MLESSNRPPTGVKHMRSTTPRLDPLPPGAWTDEQRELLQPIVDGKGLGRGVLNVFSTLVRHPKLFKRWSVFANHVLFKSSLTPREREILILRTAHNCRSAYEWGQHEAIARDAGVAQDEILRLRVDPASVEWSERDALLLRLLSRIHGHSGGTEEAFR